MSIRITMSTVSGVCSFAKGSLNDMLDKFKPTENIVCAYYFNSKHDDEPILKGIIPHGIVPKAFPGNITACYTDPDTKSIHKFKLFKTGTIHYAGAYKPEEAIKKLSEVAKSFATDVQRSKVIMVNAVGHIGNAVCLSDLKDIMSDTVPAIPFIYEPDLHSGFRFFFFETACGRCVCSNKQCENPNLPSKQRVCKRTVAMLQPTGAIQILAAPSIDAVKRSYDKLTQIITSRD